MVSSLCGRSSETRMPLLTSRVRQLARSDVGAIAACTALRFWIWSAVGAWPGIGRRNGSTWATVSETTVQRVAGPTEAAVLAGAVGRVPAVPISRMSGRIIGRQVEWIAGAGGWPRGPACAPGWPGGLLFSWVTVGTAGGTGLA